MRRFFSFFAAAILSILLPTLVLAAESSGAVIVRIPDGASSRCINASTDQVWLTMRRVILNKQSSLFTEDKYAGVVVNTTISGRTGSKTEKIGFPRMIEADIESYAAGRGVSIPVEFGLLEGFQLNNEGAGYTNVDFEFNIVKGKKRNAWGEALNSLISITKRLPMPSNPFSDGFQFFADYANSVVDSSVQERKADNIKQGNVRLSFSPNGQCSNKAFESNGTIAIIVSTPGSEADGFVDIGKINNNQYCWSAELQPAFTVKFGTVSSNGTCTPTTAIRNDYYGFFLNALPISVAKAPGLREDTRLASVRPFVSISPDIAQSIAAMVNANANSSNDELRQKTSQALQWRPQVQTVPFGEAVTTTPQRSVVWRATPDESTAFDIAEAIRRCDAHGVTPNKCLPGVVLRPDK